MFGIHSLFSNLPNNPNKAAFNEAYLIFWQSHIFKPNYRKRKCSNSIKESPKVNLKYYLLIIFTDLGYDELRMFAFNSILLWNRNKNPERKRRLFFPRKPQTLTEVFRKRKQWNINNNINPTIYTTKKTVCILI